MPLRGALPRVRVRQEHCELYARVLYLQVLIIFSARKNCDVPVWRARYFGEWPNLNPFAWLRAYHSSDIPMVFGTSDLLRPDSPAEAETSKYREQYTGCLWVR